MRDHDSVLTYRIIGAAIEVHDALGPGLLESSYRRCLARELAAKGIACACEVPIGIQYRDEWIDACYRLDFLVEGRVVVEVKSVAALTPLHDAQLLTYLRIGRYGVGLLLNFNVLSMRQGIRRIVL